MEIQDRIQYGLIHCHTEHSIKDSNLSAKRLCQAAAGLGAKAVTLTDHGLLTGMDEFMQEAKEAGIKPVIGVEFYVREDYQKNRLHLIALAMDYIGYTAISRCVTASNNRIITRGTLSFPCINKEILQHYIGPGSAGHGHVILTSACIGGVLAGLAAENEGYTAELDKLSKTISSRNLAMDMAQKLEQEKEKFLECKAQLTALAGKKYKARAARLEKAGDNEGLAALKAEMEESEQAKMRLPQINKMIMEATKNIKRNKELIPEDDVIKKQDERYEFLKGNIVTSGGLYNLMKSEALRYEELAGKGNFYIELQNHGFENELRYMPLLERIAFETGIPIVAANDVHMETMDDAETRSYLDALRFGGGDKMKFTPPQPGDCELYIKNDRELFTAIAGIAGEARAMEAMENVGVILERCNLEMPESPEHYPSFGAANAAEKLEEIARAGIPSRYPGFGQKEEEILSYQLKVIKDMGYSDYFLIVQDFLAVARKIGHMPEERYIYLSGNAASMGLEEMLAYIEADQSEVGEAVGPGRGSGAGCIVCYLTGITDIDPLKYGLIFERFLNPERVSMPDIDSDIANGVRELAIEYVRKKYGYAAVCCINTKQTMAAKGAIKNAARVYGTKKEGDTKAFLQLGIKLSAMVPAGPHETIGNHLAMIKEEYGGNPDAMEIIRMAMKLEGVVVNYGAHAAGVIIADNGDVAEYVPLTQYKDTQTQKYQWKCQCDMVEAEKRGLLKMDFLGLKNLNIITDTLRSIKSRTGKKVDVRHAPFEDEVFSEIFTKGKTTDVFQFESGGFKDVLKEFKPTCFEDLIMLVAAYRPGPMDFIPKMIAVKHGRQPLEYKYDIRDDSGTLIRTAYVPQLAPILDETYGCIIYQEQVQKIFQQLAGYSLGAADLVRRAMSKKKESVFLKEKDAFINGDPGRGIGGCVIAGIDPQAAEMLFGQMLEFAKYAFNKSHACAYAYIAYQTAWLKYHYPEDYMASVLTWCADIEHIMKTAGEACSMGISLKGPCVNHSGKGFIVAEEEGRLHIYFGLSAVKSVGNAAADILAARMDGPFRNLKDFIVRSKCQESALSKLIAAGACDCFAGNRKAMQLCLSECSGVIKKIRAKEKEWQKVEDEINFIRNFNGRPTKADFETAGFPVKTKSLPSITKLQQKTEKYREALSFLQEDLEDITMPAGILEDLEERLREEKELTGLYISGHPLDGYVCQGTKIGEVIESRKEVYISGLITNVRLAKRKKDGADMAFFTLEDATGVIEACCFAKTYPAVKDMLAENAPVCLKGKVSGEEAEDGGDVSFKVYVSGMEPLKKRLRTFQINVPVWDWCETYYSIVSGYSAEGKAAAYAVMLYDPVQTEFRKTGLSVAAGAAYDARLQGLFHIA